MTDIADLGAVALAAEIAAGRISPVEAVEAALARIYDRAELNAFVTVCADEAREAARAAEAAVTRGDALGPLHGVPFSVKDLINTKGVRTTQGSKAFEHFVPDTDAVSVARAKAAGGILIGKTTTPEFGHKPEATSPVSGRTLHPTHPDRSPGASSTGSAVAVAAGMGPLSIGSDGGGSIRIPAACCGVVGLKATLGMIPHLQLPDMFGANSYVGPMARNVADATLFFEAMAGFDRMDPYGQAVLPPEKRVNDLRGLRVGWLPNGGAKVDPEVAAMTRAAVDAMAARGAEVDEIDLDFKGMEPAFLTVLRAGLSSRVGPQVAKFGNVLDNTLLVRILEGSKLSANDLSSAAYERTRFFRLLQEALARFDVIVSPVLTAPAIPISLDTAGEVEVAGNRGTIRGAWYPFTYPLNLTGHPAISMPCGKTSEGLPVGLQIMGRWYSDRTILDVARLLEEALAGSE
ncbi:amidase [Seohaeicola zhoushanensis]|uniref:Glutamyl-tRNA amidotransferase subunit A n=1 Tax=Seohaeicola zhoushanensis TaxID=1569283 RepID=A0A8J3M815_9RHOB|nr:amidase [Seohaeicola zhoushanensis]GHF39365.1 glutamyl-tRNA amidotransferase subunit A [Seohaeicola zhoushanensis]